jgi:hypothetical protein
MVEFHLNEQLMVLRENDSYYQMDLRYYLNMYLPKQDDDIVLVSTDDVNDHNHQNIFEYYHTMNNYIVYHD